MRGYIKGPQDFIGGAIMGAFGIIAWLLTSDLGVMKGYQFGAGTAPRIFAISLCLMSLITIVRGLLVEGPPLEGVLTRGPVLILIAIIFFAVAIRPLGLAITTFALALLVSFASPQTEWRKAGVFAFFLTVFCILVFKIGLGVSMPLWPWT